MKTALLLAACLPLLPARAAVAQDGGCDFTQSTPGLGGEADTIDLTKSLCGGQAEAFCVDLRQAFLNKTAPTLTPAQIQSACRGDQARHWTLMLADVLQLQAGNTGTDAERAAVEKTYARVEAGLRSAAPSAADRAKLAGLKEYYLSKAPVWTPEQDRAIAAAAATGLDALEPRLDAVMRGQATAEDWRRWGAVDQAFRRAFGVAGSSLPDDKALMARYRKAARAFDLREFLSHDQAEASFFADGQPTPSGERVIEAAWRARLQLGAEDTRRAAERLRSDPDAARHRAAAASLAARIAAQFDAPAGQDGPGAPHVPGTGAPSPAQPKVPLAGAPLDGQPVPQPAPPRDLSRLPPDVPPYLAKLDPQFARLLLDRYDSPQGRKALAQLRMGKAMSGFDLRLEVARITELERLQAACGARDGACRSKAADQARKLVYGDGSDLRSALIAAGRVDFQKQAHVQGLAMAKALIPGYDCYQLLHYDVEKQDDAALKTGSCVFGLIPAAGMASKTFGSAAALARGAKAGAVVEEGLAGAQGADILSASARAAALARAPPAAAENIGAARLRALGVDLSAQQEQELTRLEAGVAKYNGVYRDGYHAAGHQFGEGSVADLTLRTIADLKKPAAMPQAVFDEMRIDLYKGALIHDTEMVEARFPKGGGTPEVLNADPTKVNGIDLSKLGEPVETRTLPNGDVIKMFAKAPDSRSDLGTTLKTIGASPLLSGARDPLVQYLALKGTAFSPEELALLTTKTAARSRVNTDLAKQLKTQILSKYGRDGLRLADAMAERLGVADVMNHYVRDTPSALRASVSLEKEFQQPAMVNAKGTFGFFDYVLAHDTYKPTPLYASFRQNYAALPLQSRRNFVRNLVTYRIMQARPELVADGVEKALPRLANLPEVDALVAANPGWADLPFKDLVEAVAAKIPVPKPQ